MFSYGTRGDVQPQLALAEALTAAGHAVRVGAPVNLRSFVERAGFEYAPLTGDSQEVLESEEGRRWLSSGDVLSFFKAMGDAAAHNLPAACRDALAACRDADLVIGGTFTEDFAAAVAEKRGVPLALLATVPTEPTGDYANILVTRARLPFAFLNRTTHRVFAKLLWGMLGPMVNPFRQSLGLAPARSSVLSRSRELGHPVLQAWSEHVVPVPSDNPANVVTTGHLRLPATVRARLGEADPPAHLVGWLAGGPPPVYLGFGSMPARDPEALTRMAVAVAERLDVRVIVAAGWAGLGAVSGLGGDRACFIKAVDHGWVFPQCAAVVHHGGAGTTAAALEAGVPAVVCSVFADQPFWATRVERLGTGAHVPFAKLDARSLEAALRRALDPTVKERARVLGAKLRAEDGLARAMEVLARLLSPG